MRMVSGRNAAKAVAKLAARDLQFGNLEPKVRGIIADVRRNGDRALRRYAEKWDGLAKKQAMKVSERELEDAMRSLSGEMRTALKRADANIRQFCKWQKPRSWKRTSNGISLGQIVEPLASVGCYAPGGRYPLVSTVLMTVIPAQVAGVKNIRVASPNPSKDVLGAAGMLGVKEFYRVGGAHAIAALAYGTESIPRVDKIVGPGNSYVTLAKRLVAFDCAIDLLAGPTEAVIVSEGGRAEYIAADLVAQGEHDVDALSVFITTSKELAESVSLEVKALAEKNPTALKSLRRSGVILIADSREQALEWANEIAPEHITVDEVDDVSSVQNAGSIFVGDYSAQAAGDYASGPNHVLPTMGQARFRGGLSVFDFVKIMTVQHLSMSGLRQIAPAIECLARAEGLPGHESSVRLRCASA
jgi:histidinol dehydrogenase